VRKKYLPGAVAIGFFCLLLGVIVLLVQIKPWSPDFQANKAVRRLAGDLNTAVVLSDPRGVRRLMYVPEKDYDFSDMERYLEQVAAGRFKDWQYSVLHAEVQGNYAAVIISQKPSGDGDGEITPVAFYKPGMRWRLLPFDLRKDHPEVGGDEAGKTYDRLLRRAGEWVRANTTAIDRSAPVSRPEQRH
jgi:hypothetical protein